MKPPTPFPVRFADMRDAETSYQKIPAERRLDLHDQLPFFHLLIPEERYALARRFPRELSGDPLSPRFTRAVRVAWDFRCRELVVCMVHFGDEVLAKKLDLVGEVRPAEDALVMALTASGSILDLDRPRRDLSRDWVYRPGVRRNHKRREGRVVLERPVVLGGKIDLDKLVSSEVLVLAAGRADVMGGDDVDLPEGTVLFGPHEDTAPRRAVDEAQLLDLTRFRVIVDAMGNARGKRRAELAKSAVTVAWRLQKALSPNGALPLAKVASFETVTGSRYEVVRHALRSRLDLRRFPHKNTFSDTLEGVTVGEQRVVPGAPLVVLDGKKSKPDVVAVVFEVTRVTPA